MTIEACAKVNLTLEVRGLRPDGYHDLRSLVVPVSLADTIEVEPSCDGTFASDTGYPDDLCLKAARALSVHAPRSAALGARMRVTKRIPVGGGLGGGSADAAAVLRALNGLWRLGKTPEELAAIGAEVGSDVPALVLAQHGRCPVLMEGRGEKVTALSTLTRRLDLVLVSPGVSSSTRDVYSACAAPRAAGADPSPTDAMVAALESGDLARISAALSNDLQEPAMRLYPEIAAALAALRKAGASGVLMTGSGSCVFGLASGKDEAARLSNALAREIRCERAVLAAGGLDN